MRNKLNNIQNELEGLKSKIENYANNPNYKSEGIDELSKSYDCIKNSSSDFSSEIITQNRRDILTNLSARVGKMDCYIKSAGKLKLDEIPDICLVGLKPFDELNSACRFILEEIERISKKEIFINNSFNDHIEIFEKSIAEMENDISSIRKAARNAIAPRLAYRDNAVKILIEMKNKIGGSLKTESENDNNTVKSIFLGNGRSHVNKKIAESLSQIVLASEQFKLYDKGNDQEFNRSITAAIDAAIDAANKAPGISKGKFERLFARPNPLALKPLDDQQGKVGQTPGEAQQSS